MDAATDERPERDELRALARLLDDGVDGAGELLAGRFERLADLAADADGERFLARDRSQPGRTLWVRRLARAHARRAGMRERLEELVDLQRRVDHAGLVRLRALAQERSGAFVLAGDVVDGEPVRALLERRGALAPRHALEIARQVLLVLEATHENGLPHGRIDAEHVWLASRVPWSEANPFGVGVRLVDHGLAALLGARDVSRARDLGDAARLLSELVSGTRPAADPAARAEELGAVRDPELHRLLERALTEDAARAFGDAAEFRRALERCAAWRGRPPRRRSAALAPFALGALGLLSALALGVLLLEHRGLRAAERERDELGRRLQGAEQRAAEEAQRACELEQALAADGESTPIRGAGDATGNGAGMAGAEPSLEGR